MTIFKKTFIVAIAVSLFLFLQVQDSTAQESDNTSRLSHNIDLSLAGLANSQIVSLGLWEEWGLGKNQAWKVGYGVRLSSYFGNQINHFSAPPDFYNDEATRDSVWVGKPQMSNIALYIGAGYVIKDRVEIGFNIDVVGYTFGGDKAATYIGAGNEVTTTVNPGSVTALLIGANDIGMVKSEFFAGYKFNDKFKARLGWVSLFTEYRTPTELQAGNTRYRGTGLMPMLSATYTL